MRRAGRWLRFGVLATTAVLAIAGVTLTPTAPARAAGPIVIANPGNIFSHLGDPVYLQIRATDSDLGATLTYTAELPDGLSLDSSTGVISGRLTLPAGIGGEQFNPIVTVTDSAGASASLEFGWQVSQGTYYDYPVGPMTSAYAGKCLDDRNFGTANGNPIQLYNCNGLASQNVTINGNGNSIGLMGKCVQDPGGNSAYGTPLRLWACNVADSSMFWTFYPNGNVVASSGSCLSAPHNANGTGLVMGPCGVGAFWRAPSAPLTLALDGKCVDDANPVFTPTGVAKAQMWSCNQSYAQDWSLFPMGLSANGLPVYNVMATFGGVCLDVYRSGKTNGTRVDSAPCDWSAAAQLWYLNGTELVNPNSGKCLDDPYSRTANGTLLDIWTCNGGRQQTWAAPQSQFAAEIPGTCLTGSSLNPANGAAVLVAPCAAGTRAQNWITRTDGTISVRGKCLDVTGLGTATGTRIQLYRCLSGDVAQQWRWLAGGLLKNPHSGQCLAFPGAAPATGVQLVIKPCSATAAAGDEWHTL